MNLHITNWYGLSESFAKRLDTIGKRLPAVGSRIYWEFNGTFDDFYKVWGEKFLFYPNTDGLVGKNMQKSDGIIYVTTCNSFNTQ